MTSETLCVRILVSYFPAERRRQGRGAPGLSGTPGLPAMEAGPQGAQLLVSQCHLQETILCLQLAQATAPGGAAFLPPPPGKNSSALLGWVVAHSLAWQSAHWKGKCQTISGCKNKPRQAPASSPQRAVLISHYLGLSGQKKREKKKQEKKLCGCMIRPSVTHKHSWQNHHRQCI